jgi:uncharacterized protein (TIGR00297 family)
MLAGLSQPPLWGAFLAAILLAGAAWRLGALDTSGFCASALLGGLVYRVGGLNWALLLVSFFATSSLLSKVFESRKAGLAAQFAKEGRRDWAQVAANGGVPALVLFGSLGGSSPDASWLAYAASLAVVTADTWATELGVLSPGDPRLITSGRRVPRGTSGGISLLGTLASLAGAALIGALAYWLDPGPYLLKLIGLVAAAGLLGALIDSLMGATVQAIYYCPHCEKETERHPLHVCGTETELKRGWAWLNNDWVNFLSALIAAIFALGLGIALGIVG